MLIGTRLGSYEVLAKLGEGGMGEVYRATDSNLKRSVAIKVLPASVAADLDRLARFQREAEVLAALNHPNIAAIYGLEKTPDFTALVMELVEGEDLSQRLARGAIPIDEALPIAKQIAEALEAAHEQGIIHRDLKPANVKLRPDGTVKVLDFGLAKTREQGSAIREQGSATLANSPTMVSPAQLSGVGVILGTAAYMAPEQAKGRAVDKRADIWAFGVVLYEMLTGHLLFGADDLSETMAAVLTRTIDLSALPAAAPARVRRLLARCLERDQRVRLRDIGEARIEIDKSIAGTRDDATTTRPNASTPKAVGVLPWAIAAAAIVVAAGLGVPAMRYMRAPDHSHEVTRLELVMPPELDAATAVLSPDGRQLAYVANSNAGPALWVRRLDQARATALPGTEDARSPFWAPDGRAIGFFADRKLKRIDVSSGATQVLTDVSVPRGGAWSSSGVILYAPNTNTGLMRIPDSGGTPTAVTVPESGGYSHRWPQFLPDGRHFLFRVALGLPEKRGTYISSLDGGAPTRVLADNSAAIFAPPDQLLVVRKGMLIASHFDPAHAVTSGEPDVIAEGVSEDAVLERGLFTVSAGGVLAYSSGAENRRQLVWKDAAGRALGTRSERDDAGLANPELSPDGQQVAVSRNVQGNQDVWLFDARGVPARVSVGPWVDTGPVWSADGRRLFFRTGRNGTFDIFERSLSGDADDQPLVVTPENKAPLDVSRDGRVLLYAVQSPKTGVDLWALRLDGDKKPFPVLQSAFDEMDAQFSPDGRWIAYESNQSGRIEVVVRAFPQSQGQWQVSTAGGTQPRWRADGKELYYVARDGHLMATPIAPAADGQTLTPGAPVSLFATHLATGSNVVTGIAARPQYAVGRDGRFLMNVAVDADTTPPISIVLNWDALLKK